MNAPDAAPIFAALGDETRLRLMAHLCSDGPGSITRLTAGTGMSRQAMTKHLEVLAHVGLVRGKRNGRERLYEVDSAQFRQALAHLEAIARQWDEALGRLKQSLEKGLADQ